MGKADILTQAASLQILPPTQWYYSFINIFYSFLCEGMGEKRGREKGERERVEKEEGREGRKEEIERENKEKERENREGK